ncbi:MAG: TMEM165/GDT1 family protein [Candidatus Omnitrophica bacterium]|nr:TMEM165/GDT1 family protein [Candidatus Omnitrophota bacterium]MDD5238088.1 TMEM165/GDT1 family protein [Candidatus Omnitrophota bacterium]
MDWKVFFMTFTAVFLAELADKTQLVGIGMTAKTGKPLSVWLGSVCAYLIVTVFSVFIGAVLGKYLKPELIRYFGASLFLVIGLLMFFKFI